jgi:hypothetical protein
LTYRNWPVRGEDRADTLQPDKNQKYNFTNRSDDKPQPLELVPIPDVVGSHPVFHIGSEPLQHFPDHIHEGKTLGYGGVQGSEPWTLDGKLTIKGEEFVEYPKVSSHHETPQIIAKGTVIAGHQTLVDANKFCESGFGTDSSKTKAKQINTVCVYNGRNAGGLGRVLTGSSFHHFLDLNLIGDPCASGDKMLGHDRAFLKKMEAFVLNCVAWLAKAPNQNTESDHILSLCTQMVGAPILTSYTNTETTSNWISVVYRQFTQLCTIPPARGMLSQL